MHPLNLQEGAPPLAPGHNVAAEFQALLSECGVSVQERSRLELRGSDRVRWLNGMTTNNVRDLAVNGGVYAFVLNPQGRILGDLYAYNRGGSVLVDTDPSQVEKLAAVFDRYIIMDDVEMTNVSGQRATIAVTGPKALRTLREAGFDGPPLEPLQIADLQWEEHPASVLRSDNPLVDSFEIWVNPSQVDGVKNSLEHAGGVAVSNDAVELLRIAAGVPRYGQDVSEKDLPQETGQERALNFTKGCYIGQEIVERIRSRAIIHRQFSGFLVEGSLPAHGDKIRAGEKEVGTVTSAAALPFARFQANVALGYIRREAALPGVELRVGDSQVKPAALPFRELIAKPV